MNAIIINGRLDVSLSLFDSRRLHNRDRFPSPLPPGGGQGGAKTEMKGNEK